MTAESTPDSRLAWEYLAHSEVGLVRKNNQDSGLVSGDLLMVADGMGGAAAGDLASAVAVDTLAGIDLSASEHAPPDQTPQREDQTPDPVERVPAEDGTDPSTSSGTETPTSSGTETPTSSGGETPTSSAAPDKLHQLAAAISAANTRIADLVSTDYTLEGMGTTVTAAVLDGDAIGLAHIGDSRGYLFRDGSLEQLTHDHSWVQSLIDEGKISPEEAAAHPHRSLLLKVLNGQPSNEPDLTTVPLRPGDRLLLCSDGLCGFVDDDDLAEALAGTTRREAMDQLVEAAHAAGGLDNITIIIADVVDKTTADPEATATRTPLSARPGTRRGTGPNSPAAATQEVDGPLDEPQLIGAAADRDVAGEEDQIRERAAKRAAEVENGDDDFIDADYEDAEDLEDEDRYAPQAPNKRRWRRPLILTLVVVLILAAASGAGFAWTRTQYYVGAAQAKVAIFQGLNEQVPGLPLSRVYEVQQLALEDLPLYYQGLVRNGIETGTLDSARATVRQLKQTAIRCAESSTSPSGPPPPRKPSTPTSKSSAHRSPTPNPGRTSKTPGKSRPKSTPKSTAKSTAKASPKTSPTPTLSPSPTTPGQLPGDGKC